MFDFRKKNCSDLLVLAKGVLLLVLLNSIKVHVYMLQRESLLYCHLLPPSSQGEGCKGHDYVKVSFYFSAIN